MVKKCNELTEGGAVCLGAVIRVGKWSSFVVVEVKEPKLMKVTESQMNRVTRRQISMMLYYMCKAQYSS